MASVPVNRGAFASNVRPELTTVQSPKTGAFLSEAARASQDAYADVASTGSYHNPDRPVNVPSKGRGMLVGSNVNLPEPANSIPASMPKSITSQSPLSQVAAFAKPKFQAGVPGQATSGQTVHQMMGNAELMSTINQAVEAWTAQNPKRKLKSPAFKDMLKDQLNLSDGQARRLLAQIQRRAGKQNAVDGYMRQGAGKAIG